MNKGALIGGAFLAILVIAFGVSQYRHANAYADFMKERINKKKPVQDQKARPQKGAFSFLVFRYNSGAVFGVLDFVSLALNIRSQPVRVGPSFFRSRKLAVFQQFLHPRRYFRHRN